MATCFLMLWLISLFLSVPRYILSVEDEEIIESQTTSRDKVHRLIDILLERLPQGFDELVKSLIEGRTQTHLANMLNEEFEIKRRNCYGKLK